MQNSKGVHGLADSALHPESARSEPSEQNVTQLKQPTYAASFRCIGPSCEDHCCGDWDIPLDKNTYRSYQLFPLEKLGTTVSRFVVVNSPSEPDQLYASIIRTQSGLCPFFGSDHLCDIQKEYGSHLLSSTCSIYPRSFSLVAGKLEGSLSLSCPEAARNVLLVPDFMQREEDLLSGEFRTDNFYHLAESQSPATKPQNIFLALRNILIDVVRDRSQPLWCRLVRVGQLCQELDLLALAGEANISRLDELQKTCQPSRINFDGLASNPRLRLEVVFELTDSLMQAGSSPRFQQTFWSFMEGIGTPAGSLPGNDVERFSHAEQTYYRTFFDAAPHILENYLVNYILQNLFPYGRAGSASFISQDMFSQYLQMATQFSWVNALLIGISSHHKDSFAEEHVVQTIQSFTRAVEHYPHVLNSMNEYMRSRELNDVKGMAIMLSSDSTEFHGQ